MATQVPLLPENEMVRSLLDKVSKAAVQTGKKSTTKTAPPSLEKGTVDESSNALPVTGTDVCLAESVSV
jgi:hypothetical protein